MRFFISASLLAAVGLLASTPASAAPLTADNGMTLYVFDKDQGGASSCYGPCAQNWPPYLAAGAASKGEGWATAKRKDGKAQWTYKDKPLYFFSGDKAKGDAKGDGMGGVWHAATD